VGSVGLDRTSNGLKDILAAGGCAVVPPRLPRPAAHQRGQLVQLMDRAWCLRLGVQPQAWTSWRTFRSATIPFSFRRHAQNRRPPSRQASRLTGSPRACQVLVPGSNGSQEQGALGSKPASRSIKPVGALATVRTRHRRPHNRIDAPNHC
jgi:hypothetical protein